MLSAFNSTTATVWNPLQIAAYNERMASDPRATFDYGRGGINISLDTVLVSGRDTLAQELADIRQDVARLQQLLASLATTPTLPVATVPGGLSRAQRRQLEREQARRRNQ